jgi:hypothetical protein
MICPAEPFKLPPIADAKAYLNLYSILQYYLHCPESSTLHSDDALVTDSRNAEASAHWEGQIRMAVQDGSLHFLFKNKGSMYNGKGFKMLSVLNQYCRVEFGHSCTSNSVVAFYPSWNHVVVKAVLPISVCPAPPVIKPSLSVPVSSVSSLHCIVLLKNLSAVIKQMSGASILPGLNHCFTVADSVATDHMFPDKSAFISYKLVSNLQLKMGNNSFLPVLGHGLAIISFNGQCIFVWNALHVPGLVIPLYSLWEHFTQCGCGFLGASSVGILVYFLTFVLSCNTSNDCHLA